MKRTEASRFHEKRKTATRKGATTRRVPAPTQKYRYNYRYYKIIDSTIIDIVHHIDCLAFLRLFDCAIHSVG